MPSVELRAIALDLGSTRFKGIRLDAGGALRDLVAVPSPALHGSGEIREGDAGEYLRAATTLLDRVTDTVPAGTPLGIASQRSTLVLWDRAGRPLTRLISWQDRRASSWCRRHSGIALEVAQRTGLVLSGHYAGPKLATLLEDDPDLRERLAAGEALFGTLDTWVVWNWSGGRVFETDGTMAARTAMFDLEASDWSEPLLRHFGVPVAGLPRVVPTSGRDVLLERGMHLTATVADQAAGALATIEPRTDTALVNLGTGAFVLQPARTAGDRRAGYLTALALAAPGDRQRFVLEGAINGAGPAVDRCGPGPTEWPGRDPRPAAFALPDSAGVGSPYWVPGMGPVLSEAAGRLGPPEMRRVMIEGLLFRVREVLEGLSGGNAPRRVLLSGGLTREPSLGTGLAALLGRPVELVAAGESVLTGTARLAAGLPPHGEAAARVVEPDAAAAYLPDKYPRWREWLGGTLAASREGSG